MIVALLLFALSLGGLLAALLQPGLEDLILPAAPAALASAFLLLRAFLRRDRGAAWVLLDGSNVMYWKGNTPALETLHEVLGRISREGYRPLVVFDANAGYLLKGRHANDRSFAAMLNLPENQIKVSPRGTPADPILMDAARKLKAPIVTNDRYRDWQDSHPELHSPGHLIKGGFRNGALWLDLPSQAQ